ncbi:MAG TPA: TetR/AcrR family transcriptional regulator [Pirellulaceae bacterium]|nr:TetR/AcrR family transcriptional regulator [Pirellulaceae bacterium]
MHKANTDNDLEKRQPGRPRDVDGLSKRSEAILDVAVQVFAKRGFAATDVQEIADHAGVGKGTIYRHFESKERLFLAAAELGVQKLQAAIDGAAEPAAEPLSQIRSAITAFLIFFDEHPEFIELVIQERAHFRDRATPTFFLCDTNDPKAERWQEMLRELIRRGVLRPLPIDQIMDTLTQACFGAIFVNYFGGRKKTLAQQAQELKDIVFHGILAPNTRETHS